MSRWPEIYRDVADWIAAQNRRPLLFRGHADSGWSLLPSLARMDWIHWPQGGLIEHNAYFQFITRSGNLLPEGVDAWTVAFAMQHHGMPTRLLDWSDTFAV